VINLKLPREIPQLLLDIGASLNLYLSSTKNSTMREESSTSQMKKEKSQVKFKSNYKRKRSFLGRKMFSQTLSSKTPRNASRGINST